LYPVGLEFVVFRFPASPAFSAGSTENNKKISLCGEYRFFLIYAA